MYAKILLAAITSFTLQSAIAQSSNHGNYCDASFDDAQGFWVEDYIAKVKFGTLENNSLGQFAAPHYVHYDNLNIEKFTVGQTYDLNVTFEVKGGCGYGVWIDYNQNNIFEPEEKIAGTVGTDILDLGSDIEISKSIAIPALAKPGKTRMRVRIVEDDMFNMNSTDILPCNLSASAQDVMDWGETEDYDIELIGETTSIDGLESAVGIKVYPNPASGQFMVESTTTINSMQIINTLGQVVFESKDLQQKQVQVNADLATGLYQVLLISNNTLSTTQIQIGQ